VDTGRPGAARDECGHRRINGAAVAMFARAQAGETGGDARSSARDRGHGIVTAVIRDAVTARSRFRAAVRRSRFRVAVRGGVAGDRAADGLGVAAEPSP